MKKLFLAIRHDDIETVRTLLHRNPGLVACTAKAPPKKDAGQSPLQVACKTGAIDIAHLLLDCGADVNFIEAEDCGNAWRMPVLQDAINCAVMSSRWNTHDSVFGLQVFSTQEKADKAFGLLKRMLEMGADVHAVDTYGNDAAWRFSAQAGMILPFTDRRTGEIGGERIITPEVESDLRRIWALLKEYGASADSVRPDVSMTLAQFDAGTTVARFLE